MLAPPTGGKLRFLTYFLIIVQLPNNKNYTTMSMSQGEHMLKCFIKAV